MNSNQHGFDALRSDDVFVEGMLASDVASLWRHLARTVAVREVARSLASEPTRIRALCQFAEDLLSENYDRGYRHPNDIVVCACLVILEQSPLGKVRHLFARLRRAREPSLVWVQRMAEYCYDRSTAVTQANHTLPGDEGLAEESGWVIMEYPPQRSATLYHSGVP